MPSSRCPASASLQGADVHHEELVEVGADDREEVEPLEQWRGGILRQGEHPFLELEQAQVAREQQPALGPRRVHTAGGPPLASGRRRGAGFPQQIGAHRHVERGERVRIAELRTADPGEDLVGREPHDRRRQLLIQAEPSGEPDLLRAGAVSARRGAEQREISDHASEGRLEQVAASRLPLAFRQRQPERLAVGDQGDGARGQCQHGDGAPAADGSGEHFRLEPRDETLGPRHLGLEVRPQAGDRGELPAQLLEAG